MVGILVGIYAVFKVLIGFLEWDLSSKSTDFEVHRNWKAITYSLEVEMWYYEETSEWTLDYPPLFAYFEWVLAEFAPEDMLVLEAEPYESRGCVLFMRMTVLVSELVLIYVGFLYGRFRKNEIVFYAILFNSGLFVVDRKIEIDLHFQYNGFLIGISLLSVYFIEKGKIGFGAFLYVLLVFFKHIFVYFVKFIEAPAYLFYILKTECGLPKRINLWKVIQYALLVCLTSLSVMFPFKDHLWEIFKRLFPIGRGLTHAYWAPNIWSLYNFIDLIFNRIFNGVWNTEYTKGLVKICDHSVLPNISPSVCLVLLVVLIGLFGFWLMKKETEAFSYYYCVSGMIFFACSWHVHEKAILMISLVSLEILYSTNIIERPKSVFLLNFFGNFSLFPLIFTSFEQPIIIFHFLAYEIYLYYKLLPPFFTFEKVYILLTPFVYTFYWRINSIVHKETLIGEIAVSVIIIEVYCSIGIFYSFWLFLQPLKRKNSEEEMSDLSSMGKEDLIEKIIELQETLQDVTGRIDSVRADNQNLRDENILLKEYINNLMTKAGNFGPDHLP